LLHFESRGFEKTIEDEKEKLRQREKEENPQSDPISEYYFQAEQGLENLIQIRSFSFPNENLVGILRSNLMCVTKKKKIKTSLNQKTIEGYNGTHTLCHEERKGLLQSLLGQSNLLLLPTLCGQLLLFKESQRMKNNRIPSPFFHSL